MCKALRPVRWLSVSQPEFNPQNLPCGENWFLQAILWPPLRAHCMPQLSHEISKYALFCRKERENKRKKRNSHSKLRTTLAGPRCLSFWCPRGHRHPIKLLPRSLLPCITEQSCGSLLICLSVNYCCWLISFWRARTHPLNVPMTVVTNETWKMESKHCHLLDV